MYVESARYAVHNKREINASIGFSLGYLHTSFFFGSGVQPATAAMSSGKYDEILYIKPVAGKSAEKHGVQISKQRRKAVYGKKRPSEHYRKQGVNSLDKPWQFL